MKKKILSLLMAVALVAIGVVGTLAYLKDESGEVKNKFTVGAVDIKLQESEVTQDEETGQYTVKGELMEEGEGNDYETVYPGFTYPKDPTVTVIGGSEDCWVFVKVTTNKAAAKQIFDNLEKATEYNLDAALEAAASLVTGYDKTVWVPVDGTLKLNDDVVEVVLRYYQKVAKAEEDTQLTPIMTAITIPDEWEAEQLVGLKDGYLSFYAYAIQATGLTQDEAAVALGLVAASGD